MLSVKGKFRDKKIFLNEEINFHKGSSVLVTFFNRNQEARSNNSNDVSDRTDHQSTSVELAEIGSAKNKVGTASVHLNTSSGDKDFETNYESCLAEAELQRSKDGKFIETKENDMANRQPKKKKGFPDKLNASYLIDENKHKGQSQIEEGGPDENSMEDDLTEAEDLPDATEVDQETMPTQGDEEVQPESTPAPDAIESPTLSGNTIHPDTPITDLNSPAATGSPRTNYLKNIAPDKKDEFIGMIRKIPLFCQLPEKLLNQIFEYAKFVKLKNNDHIIKEGMFDQEIFVLIKGKLDVLIKTENGDEEQIDVISQSFSLFGERCILGEQRAASIIASGDVTLLGIDLSSLPDLQEGLDDPEKRVEETRYQQSIDMYNVFSSVLIERLDRLLKDQYKLMHKIMRLHEFQDFWENNILVTLIFNEFATNQLHSDLKVGEILQKAVGKNCQQSPQLAEALKEDKINTEIVYIELVRLYSLGIIKELNNLILGITKQLADAAFKIPHYLNQIKAPIYRLPDMLSLADYLGDVFNAINDSERLTKPIEKKDLLEGYLFGNTLNPLALSDYLVEHHYVETKYDLAYVMYLACQCCIYKVGDINKVIGKYVKHLTSLNSPPMQNINSAKGRFDSLVDDMTRMQKVYMESPQESGISIIKDDQEQDSVEDLLSQYGM